MAQPIYVDIDDVLCDTARALMALLEQEFNKSVSFESIMSFDLKVSFGLTQSEYEHFMHLAHLPDQILKMDRIPEAVETLRGWMDSGHDISIVTGRPTYTHDTTLKWLSNNNVPFSDFLMVDKYSRAEKEAPEAVSLENLSKMKFHAAVEDSYDMARLIADKMKTPVYLVDRPWNRAAHTNNKIKRFHAWAEIRHLTA